MMECITQGTSRVLRVRSVDCYTSYKVFEYILQSRCVSFFFSKHFLLYKCFFIRVYIAAKETVQVKLNYFQVQSRQVRSK
jgi:hypothetical protein